MVLTCALYTNSRVLIRYLVEYGADINQEVNNETALFYSIRNSTYLTTIYLIKHGADLKKRNDKNETDRKSVV